MTTVSGDSDGDSCGSGPLSIFALPSCAGAGLKKGKKRDREDMENGEGALPRRASGAARRKARASNPNALLQEGGARQATLGEGVHDLQAGFDDDEDELEDIQPKNCDLCSQPNVQDKKRVRWEKADGRGGVCYPCARVHERRYPNKSRKELKAWVKEPAQSDDHPSNREVFDAERAKCVELLQDGMGRLPVTFATMDISQPTQSVTQHNSKFERSKRKGKNIRMDQFLKKFPNIDPRKDGRKVFKKTDEHGKPQEWVKVYNDESGIEDFSEGEEQKAG